MKPLKGLLLALGLVLHPASPGENPPDTGLAIELHASLSITGTVGRIYAIEVATDPTRTNAPDGWDCVEFLQLTANPGLWIDRTNARTGARFYRARPFEPDSRHVFAPPGGFRMGSPTNEPGSYPDSETPQTTVVITKGFWIGKCEVTQGEYLGLMGRNPSYFHGQPAPGTPDYGIDLDRPVERVSWEDATNYCAQLTLDHLARGLIPRGSRYRLPTAAEWQYACRAWTSTRFSYGEDPDYSNLTDYAWFADNSDRRTHPVGRKLPNPWGLHDMHGNVYEWCEDWYPGTNPYLPGGIVVDPQGPPSGSSRLMGGGAYLYPARACRSAILQNYVQVGRDGQIGFRWVLSAGP